MYKTVTVVGGAVREAECPELYWPVPPLVCGQVISAFVMCGTYKAHIYTYAFLYTCRVLYLYTAMSRVTGAPLGISTGYLGVCDVRHRFGAPAPLDDLAHAQREAQGRLLLSLADQPAGM